MASTDAAAWSHLKVSPARTRDITAQACCATSVNSPHDLADDDLAREVYCVLGISIDAVRMSVALDRLEAAASCTAPFLVSTPNLNFLVTSRGDRDFRETLLTSDLCIADGMPIVWIARLTGIPIRERVAGSDMFEALKAHASHKLRVYLFGGPDGMAAAAARALNAGGDGLRCVGSMSPGFGSIEEMSRSEIVDEINASDADFLVVALGAKKGQAWLLRNHHHLRIPIRAHLGATINFQTGAVRRAPAALRRWAWNGCGASKRSRAMAALLG